MLVGLQPPQVPERTRRSPSARRRGHREDQRHGHVGRVLGQDTGRVGHADAPLARRLQVDVIDAGAEGRYQTQVGPGLGQDSGIDPIGHRRHENFGLLDRLDQLTLAHRLVVQVEPRIE